MYPSKKVCLLARKKCLSKAQELLKGPIKVIAPIEGTLAAEASYYGYAVFNTMTFRGGIQASQQVVNTIVPTIWNYLDAGCAVTLGISQLLDEDNYRQKELRIKGLVNILSGIQMFVLTYNPPLVAALGITGAPAALAASTTALSALLELVTASIDLCTAYEEQNLNGWFKERQKEYQFINNKMKQLEAENELLTQPDAQHPPPEHWVKWALEKNKLRMDALQSRSLQLKEEILVRARVHAKTLKPEEEAFIKELEPHFNKKEPASAQDIQKDTDIQKNLDKKLFKAKNELCVKGVSFVGISLIAIGTFALFVTCPQAVAAVGLAITIVIAGLYLHRHQQLICNKMEAAYKKFADHNFHHPKKSAEDEKPSMDLLSTPNSPSSKGP